MLKPVKRDLRILPENYKRVSQYISDNISSLANTTKVTPKLKRFVGNLEGVSKKETDFLVRYPYQYYPLFISVLIFFIVFIYILLEF